MEQRGTAAVPQQSADIGPPEALESGIGMPAELAEIAGTLVHAEVDSTPATLAYEVGVLRDGDDLDGELSSVSASLSAGGWELDDPDARDGSYELDGWRGDDESIKATVESQPDGSIAVLYHYELDRESTEASSPGQLPSVVDRLRVHDSLTLTRVRLTDTAVGLHVTSLLGTSVLDLGTSLSISLEAPIDQAEVVDDALVALCQDGDVQCPDRLQHEDGSVFGDIELPPGYDGYVSTGRVTGDAYEVSFHTAGPAGRMLDGILFGGSGVGDGPGEEPPARGESGQAGSTPGSESTASSSDGGGGWLIPGLAGGSGVVVLVLVVLARRRRSDRDPAPTETPGPPPAVLTTVTAGLDRREQPLKEAERATRHLSVLAEADGQSLALVAVRIGEADIELLLAEPVSLAAPEFTNSSGRSWTVSRAALPVLPASGPSPYAFVAAGQLGDDIVLIDVAPGITALDGDQADVDDLTQRWMDELRMGRWSAPRNVVVDGTDERRAAAANGDGSVVTFLGSEVDPLAMAQPGDGVVCRWTDGAAATRTLVLTGTEVTIEPGGLRLDRTTAAEHDTGTSTPDDEGDESEHEDTEPVVHPRRVLVRVLGSVTIEGVEHEIRRRKVKECIAYLALHQAGVTGDQIVTALWPDGLESRDTFHQTISRARLALGNGADGEPIIRFVDGSRYRCGPEVVTDMQLLEEALAAGESTVGLIIGGTPFSETEGYEWAHLEGHAARANVLIERAAKLEAAKRASA